jgi:hypothetical protein
MIAGAQFRKFTRSGSADEKQNARALTLCFVDAERGSAALAPGRNRHQKLTWTRHIDDRWGVKTKEEHAGRELRCITDDNLVHLWHRPVILDTNATYFRNGIFNQICDI